MWNIFEWWQFVFTKSIGTIHDHQGLEVLHQVRVVRDDDHGVLLQELNEFFDLVQLALDLLPPVLLRQRVRQQRQPLVQMVQL